jgi:ABC-type Mn2+/Zn2+ transport system permease subunit
MNKRPRPVTVVGWLVIAVGIFSLAVHSREMMRQTSVHSEDVWFVIVPLLAVAAGIFTLRGHNWARWLAVLWMGAHVAISFYDSWQMVATHTALFLLIAYALFDREARAYFRHAEAAGP